MQKLEALAEAVIASTKTLIAASVAKIIGRLTALEEKVAALPVPVFDPRIKDVVYGNAWTESDCDAVKQIARKVFAEQPTPKDGKDADVEAIVQACMTRISELFDQVPMPKPGKDGTPGVDGKDGSPGVDGKDGAPGVGTPGIDGKDGTAGTAGVDGKDGSPGVDGKDGSPGVDGKDGANGVDGKDGIAGKDGANGVDGKDGSPGVDGKDGAQGIDGKDAFIDVDGWLKHIDDFVADAVGKIQLPKDGSPGVDGKDGSPGVDGKDGSPGIDGKDGSSGIDGKDGAPGVDGKDADVGAITAVVLDHVAKVLDDIPVPKDGAAGVDGKDGSSGIDGKDGAPGVDGHDGQDGHDAIDGVDGKDGAPGVDGKDGQKGFDGRDGRDGKDGDPGRDAFELDVLPAIVQERSYPRGTIAMFDGGMIRASRTTEPLNPGDLLSDAGWTCIVRGIADFDMDLVDEGRIVRVKSVFSDGTYKEIEARSSAQIWRNIWNSDGDYWKGDTVTLGGCTWHCNVDQTKERPGTGHDWQMSVKKGSDGKDGKHGDKGDKGEAGRAGKDLTQLGFNGEKH